MNVLSLFDGISCGRVALDRAGIKVGKYFASEIDKYAIQIAKKNYPDTLHIGSVVDVAYRDGFLYGSNDITKVDIDLIIGGSPCFVAGTQIFTDSGYKNIEDIVVGDNVLTHNRRMRSVLRIGNDKGKLLYSVSGQGFQRTIATGNHPYYVREMNRAWDKTSRSYKRKLSSPNWKSVENLKKGDFVGLPIVTDEMNKYDISQDEAWLLGRYLADGHTRKDSRKSGGKYNTIIFSVGYAKKDSFDHISEFHIGKHNHTKSTYRYVINNKRLHELIDILGLGHSSKEKSISYDILLLPKDILSAFFEGYMSGDGCHRNGVYRMTSISKTLVMGMNLIIAKLFMVNSSFYFFKRPKTTIIEGRTVNQNDTYSSAFRKEMLKQSNAIVSDGFVWLPINKIECLNEYDTVYNIEVDEDNSYTANNIVVHNCQDLSIAKKDGKGLQGEKSGLFFEYVRLLKEVKPKYFLLENVASMKKADKEEITRILTEVYPDTQCYLINSALVSAQHRKRLYWSNMQGVQQPEDRGILLKDILEPPGEVDERMIVNGKSYSLTASYNGAVEWNSVAKKQRTMVKVGQFNSGGQGDRVYSPEGKSVSLSANGGGRGAKTGLYEVGGVALRNRGEGKKPEFNGTEKANSMTTVQTDSMVAIMPRIGQPQPYPRNYNDLGLPRTEVLEFRDDNKTNSIITNPMKNILDNGAVIRKLTPVECERLQTLEDNYTEGISNTQRYKAIGNGWTVDVIKHILSYIK